MEGDPSGYVFTLSGPGGTYTTAPTNGQGRQAISVPAGTYTVTEQPKAGARFLGFSGAASAMGSVTVAAGQTANLTAKNEVSAPAPTATPSPPAGGTTAATTSTATTPATTASAAMQTVSLAGGCSNVVLTWPEGTPLSTVAAAVSPAGSVGAIWRFDSDSGRFRGYSPAAPVAADYIAVQARFEAVFVCLNAPAAMTRPASG